MQPRHYGPGPHGLRMMLPILDAFLQITLRRRGPEDLPDSRFLLLLAGVAYVVTQAVLASPVYASPLSLARSLVLDLLLLCGCLWGLLRLAGHATRYRQTLTAVLGTGALLSLCMLPFNYWLDLAAEPGKPALGPTIGLLAVVAGRWSSTATSSPGHCPGPSSPGSRSPSPTSSSTTWCSPSWGRRQPEAPDPQPGTRSQEPGAH